LSSEGLADTVFIVYSFGFSAFIGGFGLTACKKYAILELFCKQG
jgi:hypothetical protein